MYYNGYYYNYINNQYNIYNQALPLPLPLPLPSPSQLNPNAAEFVTDEYKDFSLPWYTTKIESYNEYTRVCELGNKLNNGGQGEIYSTKSIESNRWSLITKIYKYNNNSEKHLILQEYMIIRKTHLLFYDGIHYGANKGEIYIVMDLLCYTLKYCIKYNYAQQLHDFKCIKSNLNLKYFILEIAAFLYKLHKYNYVHLDIKPENIMFRNNNCEESVTYGNGWKLIDFGISKYINNNNNNNYIKLKHYYGTCGWSSPEMSPFANGSRGKYNIISKKTDIFSFGLVILYIINGKNIFAPDKNGKNGKNSKNDKHKDFYYNKLHGNDANKFNKKIRKHLLNLKVTNLICSDLYDLLLKMLIFDQNKRISATKILDHIWFKGFLGLNQDKLIFLKRNKTRMISKERENEEWLCIS